MAGPTETVYASPVRDKVVAMSKLGLSKREIARRLGRSAETVKHHLRTARDKGELA